MWRVNETKPIGRGTFAGIDHGYLTEKGVKPIGLNFQRVRGISQDVL